MGDGCGYDSGGWVPLCSGNGQIARRGSDGWTMIR